MNGYTAATKMFAIDDIILPLTDKVHCHKKLIQLAGWLIKLIL